MPPRVYACAFLLAASVAVPAALRGKGGEDETGPYRVVENWLKPLPNREGWTFGLMAGVFAETPDRVYVLARGEVPVPKSGGAGRAVVRAS